MGLTKQIIKLVKYQNICGINMLTKAIEILIMEGAIIMCINRKEYMQ